jgi:hypothetical protein
MVLDQRAAILNPIPTIHVNRIVDVLDFGGMDMSANHTVILVFPGVFGQQRLKLEHVRNGGFGAALGEGGNAYWWDVEQAQGPVGYGVDG